MTQPPPGVKIFDGELFYMGAAHAHYGRFLRDTLCRLWAWRQHGGAGKKILYLGNSRDDQAGGFFSLPSPRRCSRPLV